MTISPSRKPIQKGQTSPRTPQTGIKRSSRIAGHAPTSNGIPDTTPDQPLTTPSRKRKQHSDPTHRNSKRILPTTGVNRASSCFTTHLERSPEPDSAISGIWERWQISARNLDIDVPTAQRETAPEPGPDTDGTSNYSDAYNYEPLKPDEIRILIVHAGRPNSELDCDLVVRRLPALDSFEALSYCWGGQTPKHPINIRGKDHGSHTLNITKNLLDALQALRNTPPHGPRHFWVDAVCMDQENLTEKSQQLPLMSRIYGEAKNVCVWLGPESETEEASLAFKLINKLRIVHDFDRVVEEKTTCDEWLAFTALMKRDWFSRRWVVQEITMAKCATIHCGLMTILWKDFAEAIALFEEVADRVKKKFRTDPSRGQPPDVFGDVREFSASRLVTVTSNIVAKRDNGQVMHKIWDLEALVSDLTPFQAVRSHDIIYAVLALAKDVRSTTSPPLGRATYQPPLDLEGPNNGVASMVIRAAGKFQGSRFPVDYEKPFHKVCEDFLTFTTKQNQSLDIICRPWAPVERKKSEKKFLPSWVRTLAEAPFGRDPNGHWDRINANTLVGMPGQSPYSASGPRSSHMGCSFSEEQLAQSSEAEPIPILTVKGFRLDTILEIEDAARSGVIPSDWLKYGNLDGVQWDAGESESSTSKVTETFWRTMVAGKGPDGRSPPPYYSRVCEMTFTTVVENSDVNLGQIHDRSNNSLQKAYIKRVQSVVWGRKLTTTDRHNLLALIPRNTKRGDYICIIYGCSVPVVLRHMKGSKSTKNDDLYQLIGESYVHGMMDGEAFAIRNAAMATKSKANKFYEPRDFRIM